MSTSQDSQIVSLLTEILTELRGISQGVSQSQNSDFQRTPEGAPICPKHGVEMKKREKQGDVWYSHTVFDPETHEKMYCRGYPSKNGRGWKLDHPLYPDRDGNPVVTPTSPAPRRSPAPRPAPITPPSRTAITPRGSATSPTASGSFEPASSFEAALAAAALSPAIHKALMTLAQSNETAAYQKLTEMQGSRQ